MKLCDGPVICCFLPWLLVSCSNKVNESMDGKRIFQELSAADKAYRTNDARHAQAALISHQTDLQKWKAARVTGIDYDTTLAIASGRLFVLSEFLADTNRAEASYQDSAIYFKAVHKARRQPALEYTRESIRELIAKWDATDDVAWRNAATAGK